MSTLKGIEVFAVGKWNGMLFQAHDIAAMAQAFEDLKDVHKVPLKMGHNAEQPMTDGKPALGWVTALYVKGDKLVADCDDVPEVVAKAIKNKLYRRVSIELSIDVKYRGKFIPFVVDAVALLGADLPAVNTLADLNAYLSRDAAQFSVERREKFSAVAGSLKEAIEMDKEELKKAIDAAVAPLQAKFTQLEEKTNQLESTNKALTTENTALKQQVETFGKEKAKAAVDAKRTRAKAVLEGLTACGTITPAQRESFTKFLGVDDDAKIVSADIEGFLAGFSVKETAGADGKVAFTKLGAGGTEKPANDGKDFTFEEASEELDKRTRKLVAEKSVSYTVARDQVLAEDEKLALAYIAGPRAA